MDGFFSFLGPWTALFFGLLLTGAALTAAGHALLWRRDPRAAMGWIGFCLVFPLFGPFLYFLFGINRLHHRAQALQAGRLKFREQQARESISHTHGHEAVPKHLVEVARLSGAVSRRHLTADNDVEILKNGEEAYPLMLRMIAEARKAILFSTYIFDGDETGERFIAALATARERGVEVYFLLDGYGELYSAPPPTKLLKRYGLPAVRFLQPRLFPPSFHFNLRTHRKILIVDQDAAFVGGLNIGDRHLAEIEHPRKALDLHFRLRGPIVLQLAQVFAEDWEFSSGKILPEALHPSLETTQHEEGSSEGTSLCRAISDGPDADLDALVLVLVGAIAAAHHRVRIMTPYFLPPRELISALKAAALRGVDVEILLPGQNNLPYMHWATRHMLWELLQRGVKIRYQPPPFDHTKLFVIDDHYAVIGSSNLDPRSLRLNFEICVEIFDGEVACKLAEHCEQRIAAAREVTLEEVDSRPLLPRLRDGLAWLFSPYL